MVSSDTPKQLNDLRNKMKLPFALHSDQDLHLIHRLQVREGKRKIARPCVFVLDAQGRVRYRYISNYPWDRPSESHILYEVRKVLKKP